MFPPPKLLPSGVKVAWTREAKPSFRDPRLLHRKYWKLYNTVTIPILSPEEFYADALAAARDSETTRELEQALAKKCEERREELERVFKTVKDESPLHMHNLPVWAAASDSGNHGSLSSFARAIAGLVFGWDKTEAGDFPLDVSYLLPKNHWYRSKDPADCPETQVDPFYDFAELTPDDDTEPVRLRPDPRRAYECSDQDEAELEYSKSTRTRAELKYLNNSHVSQQNATDISHGEGSHFSMPSAENNTLGQASSKEKTGSILSKESPNSVFSPANKEKTSSSTQCKQNAESPAGTESDPSSSSSLSATSSVALQETVQPQVINTQPQDPEGTKYSLQKISKNGEDCASEETREEFSKTPPSPPKRGRSGLDEDEEDSCLNGKRRKSSESRT